MSLHAALAALDLVMLVLSAVCVVVGRPRRWAWVLLLCAGAWLPLNNRVLEGPVLIGVSETHGLTTADVVGVAAAVLAGLRLWAPGPGRSRAWLASRALVVVAVVVAGFVAAVVLTDQRVDQAEVRRASAPHRHPQLEAGPLTAAGAPSRTGTRAGP